MERLTALRTRAHRTSAGHCQWKIRFFDVVAVGVVRKGFLLASLQATVQVQLQYGSFSSTVALTLAMERDNLLAVGEVLLTKSSSDYTSLGGIPEGTVNKVSSLAESTFPLTQL